MIFEGLLRGEFYASTAISMILITVVMIIRCLVFRMIGDEALF